MGSQDDINNDDNDVSNDVNASPEEELRDVVLSTMTIYLLGFWLEWLVLEEPWHVFWELSRPAKTSGRVVGQLSPLLISFESKYQIFDLIWKSLYHNGSRLSFWNHTCKETLIGKQVQRVSSFFFFTLIPSFSRNASLLVGVILATMSWVDRFSRKTTWLRWEQQFSKFSWQTTRYNTYTPGKFNCHGSRQQQAMVIISLLTSVYNRSSPSCPQA